MSRRGVSAVVFDLDGTLVDSLPGIESSIGAAITECMPRQPLPDIRSVIGPPVAKMFQQLWPALPEAELHALVAAFRRHYDAVGCLQTRLYDGVSDSLIKLRERGVELFVLTNKPAAPTQRILHVLGIEPHFRALVSPDSSDPPFSVKSEGAAKLQEQYRLRTETTLLVGDGHDDARAAAHCGFGFIAAEYGYGDAIGRRDLWAVGLLRKFS